MYIQVFQPLSKKNLMKFAGHYELHTHLREANTDI